jgi:hypothetical protein
MASASTYKSLNVTPESHDVLIRVISTTHLRAGHRLSLREVTERAVHIGIERMEGKNDAA